MNINCWPLSLANHARYFLGFLDGLTYVLDDHNKERQLNGEGLLRVKRACDEVSANVSSHDLENRGGNIGVSDSLNMSVAHVLVPDLQRFGTK